MATATNRSTSASLSAMGGGSPQRARLTSMPGLRATRPENSANAKK
ncbi:MAG: hypothetical protein IPN34_20985 [Planctomycetes bacterium]|nr:hypothetical protein [Planctomycetota bacterium]